MMSDQAKQVTRAMEAYKSAVWAKDVEGFVGLYDEDVRIFDLWTRVYDGATAWRKMASDWLGTLGDERVAVEFKEVHAVVDGTIATAQAFVTYAAISADGRKLRSLQNRLTWTLRQKEGTWKIVHEHTSAPISGETMKAIL